MMKRLLALTLALCFISSANATYLQIDGLSSDTYNLLEGSTVTISIISEDNSSWLGYLIVPDGKPGVLSNPTIWDAAGNLGSAIPYTEVDWGTGYELTAAANIEGVPALEAGQQFTFDFSGGFVGQTTQLLLFADPEYSIPLDAISITIVPEPITIALLGLGAILLRRIK
ncbi:MAG: PEP-CTERM sorting domain-containing protein [Sedimentisphaerales bacterium]|nr:PEP-CTERM sorting domain-containing protein [Sedimentisphaerales bacterium]